MSRRIWTRLSNPDVDAFCYLGLVADPATLPQSMRLALQSSLPTHRRRKQGMPGRWIIPTTCQRGKRRCSSSKNAQGSCRNVLNSAEGPGSIQIVCQRKTRRLDSFESAPVSFAHVRAMSQRFCRRPKRQLRFSCGRRRRPESQVGRERAIRLLRLSELARVAGSARLARHGRSKPWQDRERCSAPKQSTMPRPIVQTRRRRKQRPAVG